jgi:acyl-coenzyme A thioesterase PaaI-like protein
MHASLTQQVHAQCLICGSDDPLDLKLQFKPGEDGSMTVIFPGERRFQGYAGRLHGGIIATLFDSAMTHCLFANGLTGVTASLNIRFRLPVTVHQAVQVKVWVEKRKLSLCRLRGTLQQNGVIKGTGEAMFWLENGTGEYGG